MDPLEKPPVAANFLVVFDQKVGYTTAWKRAVPDLDLDGVEYKSLPSGLHTVTEDVVYFMHRGHAGISAFAQGDADARHRNATFVAVGALVPLTHGRLGRAWAHAAELRRLARALVRDVADTRPLELHWKQQPHAAAAGSAPAPAPAPASPSTTTTPARTESAACTPLERRKRKRALSDAATAAGLMGASAELPPDHPALSMPDLLDAFGPLIFPLHRAALLRKRVLIVGTPPVQAGCNAVYITSILSSIPPSLYESLPDHADSLSAGRPLFSVGVHDLGALSSDDGPAGWLACTTDDILGEKRTLYDLLVKMPAADRPWPELRSADGRVVKASQRDLRRWKLLRRELTRLRRRCMERDVDGTAVVGDEGEDEERPLLAHHDHGKVSDEETASHRDANETVEPSSWTALAYKGFMWWASAGEASAWENDETKSDEELLFDLPDIDELLPTTPDGSSSLADLDKAHYSRAVATVVVAYFRRLTVAMLKPLAEIVEDADDDTEQGIQEDEIVITMDDVREMGLDTWSATDKEFVNQLGKVWFQLEISVAEGGVKVCGLRVC